MNFHCPECRKLLTKLLFWVSNSLYWWVLLLSKRRILASVKRIVASFAVPLLLVTARDVYCWASLLVREIMLDAFVVVPNPKKYIYEKCFYQNSQHYYFLLLLITEYRHVLAIVHWTYYLSILALFTCHANYWGEKLNQETSVSSIYSLVMRQ